MDDEKNVELWNEFPNWKIEKILDEWMNGVNRKKILNE